MRVFPTGVAGEMTSDRPAPESPPAGYEESLGYRELEDGRALSLWPMLFGNTRLCIGLAGTTASFDDGYCYHHLGLALRALAEWDGCGDPQGWFKHLGSGRLQHAYARPGTPPPIQESASSGRDAAGTAIA